MSECFFKRLLNFALDDFALIIIGAGASLIYYIFEITISADQSIKILITIGIILLISTFTQILLNSIKKAQESLKEVNRNLEKKVNLLLNIFPVVLILGARQTGKTTLAKMCRPEWRYFDLEKGSDYDFITTDFDFFFREYPEQVIIDEAQESPQLFRELRGVIDANRKSKNTFSKKLIR